MIIMLSDNNKCNAMRYWSLTTLKTFTKTRSKSLFVNFVSEISSKRDDNEKQLLLTRSSQHRQTSEINKSTNKSRVGLKQHRLSRLIKNEKKFLFDLNTHQRECASSTDCIFFFGSGQVVFDRHESL
jgi:hypothetical protein